MALTYREAKVIRHMLNGCSKAEAMKRAGFSIHLARHPDFVMTEEMEQELARLQTQLVNQTLEVGLIDATEILEYLTEAIRADMRDIRNDDGSFKPQSEWPEIWGRMMEAGDVEVEYEAQNSPDEDDDTGRILGIKKVKLKFQSKTKLLELAMKHKGVNAMAVDDERQGNVTINVVYQSKQQPQIENRRVITIEAKKSDD